ncbi:hypothetical protein L9F63_010596, partial [Diploptera punctata]
HYFTRNIKSNVLFLNNSETVYNLASSATEPSISYPTIYRVNQRLEFPRRFARKMSYGQEKNKRKTTQEMDR